MCGSRGFRIFLSLVSIALGSCSQPIKNEPLLATREARLAALKQPAQASDPLLWRNGDAPNADFLALALSGGGVKSATFSGEVMFYLDAIGLMPNVKMISSVSGGSYAASRYAISCDEADVGTPGCVTGMTKKPRPVWNYTRTMPVFTQSFDSLIWRATSGLVASLVAPWVSPTVTPSTYAEFLGKHYLQPDGGGDARYTFGYIDERKRPRLVLNATLVSDYRNLTEASRATGYLRRRNGDEYFHFAFTDYFLKHIGSDYKSLPIEYGVAASGAFPALIGYVSLRDYRRCARTDDAEAEKKCWDAPKQQLALIDGGANDNQALAELYATVGEILLSQARSDLSADPGGKYNAPRSPGLQTMRKGDRALIFAINSSITVATGLQGALDSGWGILHNINRSLEAVNVYSGTAVNLRLRLYLQNLEVSNGIMREVGWRNDAVKAMEIGLVTLDDYPWGGAESANVWLADIKMPPASPAGCKQLGFDTIACELAQPKQVQAEAYDRIRRPEIRHALGLSRLHPQCLFEQSKLSDVGLTSVDPHVSVCLRHAARWATALRMQELCMGTRPGAEPALNDMASLACEHGDFTHLSHLKPGINSGELAECRFGGDGTSGGDSNSDEDNRDILAHLLDNPVFTEELGQSPGKPEFSRIRPADLKGEALIRTIEDICDLDKIYPHS
jgi:hypothetical protein